MYCKCTAAVHQLMPPRFSLKIYETPCQLKCCEPSLYSSSSRGLASSLRLVFYLVRLQKLSSTTTDATEVVVVASRQQRQKNARGQINIFKKRLKWIPLSISQFFSGFCDKKKFSHFFWILSFQNFSRFFPDFVISNFFTIFPDFVI